MPKIKDNFLQSIQILNSVFSLVIAAFFLDILTVVPFIQRLGILRPVVFVPLKIFLYSGIYGALVELISKEEDYLRVKRLIYNSGRFWKPYAVISLMSFFVYYFVIKFFGVHSSASLSAFSFYFEILSAALLSYYMINKKYIKKYGPGKKTYRLNFLQFFAILLCAVIATNVFNLIGFFQFRSFFQFKLYIFLSRYCLFFIYVFISKIYLDRYPDISSNFVHDKEIYVISPASSGTVLNILTQFVKFHSCIFSILRALSPKEYKVKEFNRVNWANRFFCQGKLVAITCFTSNSYEGYKIAKKFRDRGSKVIMGGPHVNFFPDEALEYCDSAVLGEAEAVWGKIIEDFEKGALKKKYFGEYLENFSEEFHVDIMKLGSEYLNNNFEITRGCKFRCEFCAVPVLTGNKIRKKPLKEVISLIERVRHKYSNIFFSDDNIYADPKYAKEFFKALIPLKIKWFSQCSLDIANDEEALDLAKESGCSNLLIGYEIANDSKEREKGGKFVMLDKYVRLSRIIKKKGITIKGHFIIGFEKDTYLTMFKLIRSCFFIMPKMSSVAILTPFPGTLFFKRICNADKLINLNWKHYDGLTRIVFDHERFKGFVFNSIFPLFRIIFMLTTSAFGMFILMMLFLVSLLMQKV